MKPRDKVFVITGGGSGLGRELALQLLAKGAWVAIADINDEGMEETRSLAGEGQERLSIHHLDISNKEEVFAFPEKVIEAHGIVDGVINNAGIIQPFVPVKDLGFDTIDRIMRINFYGTLYMVKAFLPYLLERPEGHIVNVSSMGGFIPFPGQTFYSASKAGVKLLTEGLHSELRDSNVRVTLILPGGMNTNIMKNSGVERSGSETSDYKNILTADVAAKMTIEAMEKNKYRKLVGKDARMLDKLYRLAPAWASGLIAKKMAQRSE